MDLLTAIKPEAVYSRQMRPGVKHVATLGSVAHRGDPMASNDYYHPKFRPCRHSSLQRRSPRRSAITKAIIGPGQFDRTAACGSTMRSSKSICVRFDASALIWRRRRSSSWAFIMKSPVRYCSCPVSRWWRRSENRSGPQQFADKHLQIGIDSLKQLINRGLTVSTFALIVGSGALVLAAMVGLAASTRRGGHE